MRDIRQGADSVLSTARKLQNEGVVDRVGIIDCDVHYGDGTDDIIQTLKHCVHEFVTGHSGRSLWPQCVRAECFLR